MLYAMVVLYLNSQTVFVRLFGSEQECLLVAADKRANSDLPVKVICESVHRP